MPEDTIKDEEYAPITQELREYIERHPTMMHAVGLADLLDNIDAIHKSLEDECAEMHDFCERVEQAAQAREDVTFWGVDYMPLPLDADGVPIHIGDVMEWCDSGEKLTVDGIGIDVLFYIDGENAEWTAARNKHHHHEPTVEDVLREFVTEFNRDDTELCGDEIIERFAKRLQLAEGDAE